jgi:hypothetical protein
MSMRHCSDTIGNRTCDLPACSAVPQLRHRVPCLTKLILRSPVSSLHCFHNFLLRQHGLNSFWKCNPARPALCSHWISKCRLPTQLLARLITIDCVSRALQGVTWHSGYPTLLLRRIWHFASKMIVQTAWPERPACNKGVQLSRICEILWEGRGPHCRNIFLLKFWRRLS